MRKLFWIDDDMSSMEGVARGTFIQLWREKIKSTVYFFGNNYKYDSTEKGYIEEDRKRFIQILAQILREFCRSESRKCGKPPRELWMEYKEQLIPKDCVKILDENKSSQIVKEVIEKIDNEDRNQQSDCEERVVNYILEETHPDGKGNYAIDIALFHEDEENIISMLLYHGLKERKHNCFLYTIMGYDETFIYDWKKRYCKIYNESVEPEIAYRENLNVVNLRNDDIDRLIGMCKENTTQEENVDGREKPK